LINITKKLKARNYINPQNGKELYRKEYFADYDIDLNFIDPILEEYKQRNHSFVPGLSIIDVMMFNSKEEIRNQLENYKLE